MLADYQSPGCTLNENAASARVAANEKAAAIAIASMDRSAPVRFAVSRAQRLLLWNDLMCVSVCFTGFRFGLVLVPSVLQAMAFRSADHLFGKKRQYFHHYRPYRQFRII